MEVLRSRGGRPSAPRSCVRCRRSDFSVEWRWRKRKIYRLQRRERDIYPKDIDVCCLVPFLFSFPFHEPSYFSFRPLSNVSISVRGPVLVLVLMFSPDAGAIDDIICISTKRVFLLALTGQGEGLHLYTCD